MARIALRTYLSQIEELTDSGQTAEALAHCRHILERFPKNIATYRAMAKAYLESKQHAEASDIFQRVLSSCPDDFVAHIGMSIIREEAGDQDGAIWHMERAFEAQPSNRAVQDELRRLYGTREGYTLPKVRLTRGALARMYAHGDLYNQAIGELRGALAEDPQRPDLQVLLAEMLLKSQRQAEAVEVCGQLIEKFPYCLFANQAMAEILTREQREIEANPYSERVEELDPYAAQTDTLSSAESVPADSVLIEKLAVVVAEQPLVASESDESIVSEETLPDWLSLEPEDLTPESLTANVEEEASQPKTTSSLLENLESMEPGAAGDDSEQLERFGKTSTAALVDDQVPDWLRGLTPVTRTLSEEAPPQAPEPRKLSWTEELRSAGLQPTSLPDDNEPQNGLAAHREEPQIKPATPVDDEESLRWLEGLAATQGAQEEELLTTPEDRQHATPEWAPQVEAEPEPKSDTLAWLDDIEQRQQVAAAQRIETQELTSDAGEPGVAAEQADAGEAEPVAGAADSLDDIFADAPFSSETHSTDAEPRDTPGWLQELSSEIEDSSPSPAPEPKVLEDTPDWLNELRYQTGELALPESEDPSPAAEDAAEPAGEDNQLSKLDWLNELGPPSHQPPASAWVPEAELAGEDNNEEAALDDLPAETQVAVAESQEDAGDWQTPNYAADPARSTRSVGERQDQQDLEEARRALDAGDQPSAVQQYGALLRRRKLLDEIIADLQAATAQQPDEVELWQTLGDAYMRNNQLRQALECYTRAEDLL